MRAALACLLGVGCSFSGSSAETDGAMLDAAIDAEVPPDSTVAMVCGDWNPIGNHFDPCMITFPATALDLLDNGTYTLRTDDPVSLTDPLGADVPIATHLITQAGVETALLVSVATTTIGANATLRAEGDRPVIIASWSGIRVNGTIDVSTSISVAKGAGGNSTACMPATPGTDSDSPAERGGGGGGGFGDVGGDGGDGNNGASNAAGTGGGALAAQTRVHGGCPGAVGGGNAGGGGGGGGGAGGGAVQLSAFGNIFVAGTINANGSGGLTTGVSLKGGGGAGSGGYIGLDAATVTLPANVIMVANGGGGGEGNGDGGQINGQNAVVGVDPAPGGAASTDGGDGGVGGAQLVEVGGPGMDGAKGGGGGGGSVGVIQVLTGSLNNLSRSISPALP